MNKQTKKKAYHVFKMAMVENKNKNVILKRKNLVLDAE